MKQLIVALGLLIAANISSAQQKPTDLDKSPLDFSYYPANYPILKMQGKTTVDPQCRIIYSRPQKRGRTIFGGEVKYNEVWRLGANESTEIELFKAGYFAGKRIPKGRYTLYCIPTDSKWTIIFNKDKYTWGSFTYNQEVDYARIDVPVQKNSEDVEALTIYFNNSTLTMMWDDVKVEVPVSF